MHSSIKRWPLPKDANLCIQDDDFAELIPAVDEPEVVIPGLFSVAFLGFLRLTLLHLVIKW